MIGLCSLGDDEDVSSRFISRCVVSDFGETERRLRPVSERENDGARSSSVSWSRR